MRLADRAGRATLPRTVPLDDGGYIMVVLLIGMAAAAIWMSAAIPAWRQQAVREKEAELIFRGEQYARAIYLYRQKNGQTSPPNIDTLVQQRYLRKKYLDPITGKDFVPVTAQSAAQAQPGQPGQPGRPGGPAPGVATVGLMGVRSGSNEESIILYQGQSVYSQFPFDWSLEAQRSGGMSALPMSEDTPVSPPGLGGEGRRGRGGIVGPGGGRRGRGGFGPGRGGIGQPGSGREGGAFGGRRGR